MSRTISSGRASRGLGASGDDRVEPRRLREAGKDVVDGDAEARQFAGERLRPAGDRGARRVRHAQSRDRLAHRGRDDVDDAAVARLLHPRDDGLREDLVVDQVRAKRREEALRARRPRSVPRAGRPVLLTRTWNAPAIADLGRGRVADRLVVGKVRDQERVLGPRQDGSRAFERRRVPREQRDGGPTGSQLDGGRVPIPCVLPQTRARRPCRECASIAGG
mgnify:CR=1 FL=1